MGSASPGVESRIKGMVAVAVRVAVFLLTIVVLSTDGQELESLESKIESVIAEQNDPWSLQHKVIIAVVVVAIIAFLLRPVTPEQKWEAERKKVAAKYPVGSYIQGCSNYMGNEMVGRITAE